MMNKEYEDLKEKYSQIIEMDRKTDAKYIIFPSLLTENAKEEYNELWLINGVEYLIDQIKKNSEFHMMRAIKLSEWLKDE